MTAVRAATRHAATGDRGTWTLWVVAAACALHATEAGACTLAYDAFAIRDPARATTSSADPPRRVGWRDSLDAWGVACRGGRLVRAAPGTAPPLRRTGPWCAHDAGGGLACTRFPAGGADRAGAP